MNSLSKKIDIRKIAFTFILLLIITRKYLISFINPSIDIGLVKSLLFYGSILGLLILFITDSKKSVSEIILVGICFILYLLNREGAILLIVLLAYCNKLIVSMLIFSVTDKFFKYRLVVTYKKRKFNNTLIIECTTFLSP